MDLDLLHLLRTRENFEKYRQYIKENTVSKETGVILNWLTEEYKNNPKKTEIADWDAFGSWWITYRGHLLTTADAANLRLIFNKLGSYTTSSNYEDVLSYYVTQFYTTKVTEIALSVAEGKKGAKLDDIVDVLKDYDKTLGRAISPTDLFVSTDLSSIATSVSSPGFLWPIGELNRSCGPIRQGDFIVVGARPESGKTTFLAFCAWYMATQLRDDRPVVWVNNEEHSDKVMFRVQQSALGWTSADIFKDTKAAEAAYEKIIGNKDKIRILRQDAGCNHIQKLDALFRETNPALIIIDQLDKVEGFTNEDREDLRIGQLYWWARRNAHEYGPVIAASQAIDSAENEELIYPNQLRGSRTDKAGEADVILTLGWDRSKGNQRTLFVPKNKLLGGTEPSERHGVYTIDIQPEIARYSTRYPV